MRRLSFVAAALLAALLFSAANSSANRARPTITMHVGSSVVVDGSHFRRHERVKVTSSTGGAATVHANAAGSFTVTLRGGVPTDRCSALVVRAVGSDGSSATARRPPLPQCAPMGNQGASA